MRIYLIAATLLASLTIFVSFAQTASAQAPANQGFPAPQARQNPGSGAAAPIAPAGGHGAGALASKYGIGLVDVTYIFKHYKKFNMEMERLQAEMTASETQLRKEREQITQSEEALQTQFPPGSAEFKRLDEEITEKKAAFNLNATKQQKHIMERQAKIFFQAYLEVNDAVKYHALRHNLALVLRFNGDRVDPNRREEVLRAINRPVVYQNGIDITPDVLGILERDPQAGNRPPQQAQRSIPGQPAR